MQGCAPLALMTGTSRAGSPKLKVEGTDTDGRDASTELLSSPHWVYGKAQVAAGRGEDITTDGAPGTARVRAVVEITISVACSVGAAYEVSVGSEYAGDWVWSPWGCRTKSRVESVALWQGGREEALRTTWT